MTDKESQSQEMPVVRKRKTTSATKSSKKFRQSKGMKLTRSLAGTLYPFRRTTTFPMYCSSTGWNFAGGSTYYGQGLAFAFTFGNVWVYLTSASQAMPVPGSSEFNVLFDSFMIKKVIVEIIPAETISAVIAPGSTGAIAPVVGQPWISSAIDYNDSVAPTTDATLQQYETYKLTGTNNVKTHKRTIYPKVAPALYDTNSGSASSYGTPTQMFVQTSSSENVAHYGLKLWNAQYFGGNYQQQFLFRVTYDFVCRTTR